MLHVHFSNRYEALVDILRDRLDARGGDIFAADQVIVPSAAVRRSLTLALADRHGICANVEFSFLAHWLWQQIRRLVPDAAPQSPFAPETLTWRIYGSFAQRKWIGAHPRLAVYLDGADDVMRFELASRIATLFDQYLTYRPDWLQAWSQGRLAGSEPQGGTAAADQRWQAALWRQIMEELQISIEHPASRFAEVVAGADAATLTAAGIPEAIHVFALPAIPPLHLEVLRDIGRHAAVYLYVLNPCREYWFEIIPPGRLAHLEARDRDAGHEIGNRLLASWGRQTQSHIDLLIDTCPDAASDDGAFQPRTGASLLARLQNSVLDMNDIPPGSVAADAGDRSIEVHVCHSLTRELEVLHDYLLGLFEAGGLRPSDILVVTPDIEEAAPMIDAVFGTVERALHVPYEITGRARSSINAPARSLLEMLSLVSSRCTASALFAALQQPIVARRFELDEAGLDRVHAWIRTSGARWGLDAQHRASFDLPADPRHTLADALDRLFLGYALPSDHPLPFAVGAAAPNDTGSAEILPCGDAEGTEAAALGAFAAFVAAVRRLRESTLAPLSPAGWRAELQQAIGVFLAPEGSEIDDANELLATIGGLADELERGGIAAPLPLAVIRSALAQRLDDPAHGGVPSGGVTFTSLSSLRGVPFPVVCAVGLDDGRFPAAGRPPEFDLIARNPRRGDRQRRLDDRNLFLDLVLAARRNLYLSYTGRSVRDNAPLPPSVLVAELLDVLVPAIAADPECPDTLAAARRRLVIEHPLQPFSPDCFKVAGDQRLRSYNADLGEAVRHSAWAPPPADAAETQPSADESIEAAADQLPPFFSAPLPPPGPEWRRITLDQLFQFLCNPCNYLLRHRLHIDLWQADEAIEEDEPFVADFSSTASLARRLLPALLDGVDVDIVRRLARAGTEMPSGYFGTEQLEAELKSMHAFAERVRMQVAEPPLPPYQVRLEFDLHGETWHLDAGFADLRRAGLVRWDYKSMNAISVLSAWLHHLVLCAAPPSGTTPATRWLLIETELEFPPIGGATSHLAVLLDLYRRGLSKPVHFFPKTAWEFSKMNGEFTSAVINKWAGREDEPGGEGDHPAYKLALRGVADPLDLEFKELAKAVFTPLIAALPPEALKR